MQTTSFQQVPFPTDCKLFTTQKEGRTNHMVAMNTGGIVNPPLRIS